MTGLILFAIGAAGALVVAFAALAIFTVIGSTRRSRYAQQVTPRDERGPGHPDIDAFLADLAKRNEERHS